MRSGVSRKSVLWAAGLGLLLLVLELTLPSTTRVWPYPHESAYGTTGPMILMVPLLSLIHIFLELQVEVIAHLANQL